MRGKPSAKIVRLGSAPVATRVRGPQPADRRRARDECAADSPMPRTALQAAWIVCPLHRVYDRVETRGHQVAQMPSPTVFALHHARSDCHDDQSTLAHKSQFLVLRPVISTLYCRHLATDAENCLFSLQTAPWVTHHGCHCNRPAPLQTGSRFLHMRYTCPTASPC